MTTPKVLVIDDDYMTCNLVETFLKMEGFKAASIHRIENDNIISVVQKENPNIILLDYHLGSKETTRYVAALRASEQWLNLPIIMTSAIDYSRICLAAGATDFIVKPFNWDEITNRIKNLLNNSVPGGSVPAYSV